MTAARSYPLASARLLIVGRLMLSLFCAISVDAKAQTAGSFTTYYVDQNHLNASDTNLGTDPNFPLLTIQAGVSKAQPGDTVLISDGKYGDNVDFIRSGVAGNPITIKGQGSNVIVGVFNDIDDGTLQPSTTYQNAYQIDLSWASQITTIGQTYFDDIFVDDTGNLSNFFMRDEDGPIKLQQVSDSAELQTFDGTYLISGSTLYIHPYGDRAPSNTNTDFVAGTDKFGWQVDQDYLVIENLKIWYSQSSTLNVVSAAENNIFRKLWFAGQLFFVAGDFSLVEDSKFANGLMRASSRLADNWVGDLAHAGSGGLGFTGQNQVGRNLEVYHNWNNMGTNFAVNLLLENITIHGSPNHCYLPVGVQNLTIRNMVQYNCQDQFYFHETESITIEHTTVAGGVHLQAINAPIGPVVIRNSILTGGDWNYDSTFSTAIDCSWEGSSIFENNIVPSSTTIRHCEDNVAYPINDYIAKCQAGQLQNCMTVQNNILLDTDFTEVIVDGKWTSALGDLWNVQLTGSNSPAIDAGAPSQTTIDFEDDLRPQGSGFDIGADEFATGTIVDTTPPSVSIISPTNGETVSNTTTISASASDNIGIFSVRFEVDGTAISTDATAPYSISWDTTTVANGSHAVTAVATDASGNTKTSGAVTVTVDNAAPPPDTTPPTVAITSPTAGSAISCTVTLLASASDNVGIQSVQFKMDGAVIASDTTSPYSTSWGTTAVANGPHSLTAVASDTSGNATTSSSVTVTINNLTTCSSVLSISNLTVASGKAYEVVENGLADGVLVYIDRSITYSSLLASLEGATYIKTANDDKLSQDDQLLSFEVNQSVTVYVAHDNRYQIKPDWLLQFEDTGEDLTTTDTSFSIFQKVFPAGTVVLGGNVDPTEAENNSMYTVIVVASNESTPPAAPIGLRVTP